MRRAVLPVLCLLLPCALAAGGLSDTYRWWDASPEAYFLTLAERTQWKQVKTDADAEKFVADYYARRNPDLPAMLKERIGVADKSFSSGKTRGSETLRGRVIILFGPPTRMTLSKPNQAGRPTGDRGDLSYASAGAADPHTNVGPGASGLSMAVEDPVLSIIYDAKEAPAPIGKAFRVELKMKTNAKQEAVDPKDLDEKFEIMAKVSIRKLSE